MKLTDEEFEREWKNAETCVDALLKFYAVEGWNRRGYFEACMEGTMDLPNGEVMTALTSAVLFEQLLKEKEKRP